MMNPFKRLTTYWNGSDLPESKVPILGGASKALVIFFRRLNVILVCIGIPLIGIIIGAIIASI